MTGEGIQKQILLSKPQTTGKRGKPRRSCGSGIDGKIKEKSYEKKSVNRYRDQWRFGIGRRCTKFYIDFCPLLDVGFPQFCLIVVILRLSYPLESDNLLKIGPPSYFRSTHTSSFRSCTLLVFVLFVYHHEIVKCVCPNSI